MKVERKSLRDHVPYMLNHKSKQISNRKTPITAFADAFMRPNKCFFFFFFSSVFLHVSASERVNSKQNQFAI